MAVSKKAKGLYNAVFDGTETFAANCISRFGERRDLKKYKPTQPIPKDYAKSYKAYWRQFGLHVSPMWGWYYAARNGNMDVRYVPHTLHYTRIDQYFNARKLGYGFNDKNYYSKIFSGIKQPETVVRVFQGGQYTDADYQQISLEASISLILQNKEVICKPSQESGSGRSIEFWRFPQDEPRMREFLSNRANSNYLVQKIIKQHPDLAVIHPSSINTIRVCSFLMPDGVHILSSVLRMGAHDSRVDNATAGGVSCGINPDGSLQSFAYNYYSGAKTDKHPQGYVFGGHSIPSYEKIVELVKTAHPIIGNFRLTSWDVAIDETGDPLLIEANMRKGGINFHQFSNGPLFGDLTDELMREIFMK